MVTTKLLAQFILGVYIPVTAMLRSYLRYYHQTVPSKIQSDQIMK